LVTWLELARTICDTDMDLVHRGRLSVQRVRSEAWDVIEQLAERGGWSEEVVKGKKRSRVEKEERESKRKTRNGRTGDK
jgi:hypothetical protein